MSRFRASVSLGARAQLRLQDGDLVLVPTRPRDVPRVSDRRVRASSASPAQSCCWRSRSPDRGSRAVRGRWRVDSRGRCAGCGRRSIGCPGRGGGSSGRSRRRPRFRRSRSPALRSEPILDVSRFEVERIDLRLFRHAASVLAAFLVVTEHAAVALDDRVQQRTRVPDPAEVSERDDLGSGDGRDDDRLDSRRPRRPPRGRDGPRAESRPRRSRGPTGSAEPGPGSR